MQIPLLESYLENNVFHDADVYVYADVNILGFLLNVSVIDKMLFYKTSQWWGWAGA